MVPVLFHFASDQFFYGKPAQPSHALSSCMLKYLFKKVFIFFQVLRPGHQKSPRRRPQKLGWTTQLMILASHMPPMTTHSSRGHEERKSSKKRERRRKTMVGFLLHLGNCNVLSSPIN